MTLAFHATADGWLRPLDARWKIAGFVALSVGVLALSDPLCAFAVAMAVMVISRSAGVSTARLAGRLVPVVGMLILFFGWSLFRPRADDPTWTFFGLVMSPTAGWRLLLLLAKATAFVAIVFTLVETTPLPELGQGAAALGIPRLLVHLVLLTYRYVFVLGDEFARLRRALRVRGFRSQVNRRTFATIGNIAGALFVRGHERSERVYHAMAARGFDGTFHSLAAAQTSSRDIAFFAVAVVMAAAVLVWDRGRLAL